MLVLMVIQRFAFFYRKSKKKPIAPASRPNKGEFLSLVAWGCTVPDQSLSCLVRYIIFKGNKYSSFCLRISTQQLFLIVGFWRTQQTLLLSKSRSTTVTQMSTCFQKQTQGKKEAIPKIGRLCLKKAGFLNSLTDSRNFFREVVDAEGWELHV